MDGNRVTMSDTSPKHGVEVQYSPYGDEVITVVARNTQPGPARRAPELSITSGDLINLVEDQRLRLPSL